MSEKEFEESGFRVVDKRRFESDGSAKADSEPGKEKFISATANLEASSSTASVAAKPVEAKSSEGQFRDEPLADGEVDFPSFVISLATQALALMGEAGIEEGAHIQVDLAAAKQTIDIIAMLHGRTKGNLTREEDKLMTEVVSSLRMAFVGKVQK